MEYYNLQKTAEVLNMTTGDVNRLREQGKLHGFRDGSDWKFKDNEVKDYLAGVIKGRTQESDPYKDEFSLDDDIALSDDGVFTSLLDKATDKISSSSSSDRISLEKASPFSDGSSDLDLAGDSGISLADDNDIHLGDIQLGGSAGSSIQDNLSNGQDSGLSLLDDELDFSKDELKLSGDSGLSLMDDSNSAFDIGDESEEETRLADFSADNKASMAIPLAPSDSDQTLNFDNSTIGDDEMTVQMSPGSVENFQAPQAENSPISLMKSKYVTPATPDTTQDEDILSFGNESDDEAATVMVDNSHIAGAAHRAMDSEDGVFQLAPSDDTSIITGKAKAHDNSSSKTSTSSTSDIFSLSGDDDDEAPTVLFGGNNADQELKVASDSDAIFELVDAAGPKPTAKEADDFINLVKDDLAPQNNAEKGISQAKKDTDIELIPEDFNLDAISETGEESDSESASQMIDVDPFLTEESDSDAVAGGTPSSAFNDLGSSNFNDSDPFAFAGGDGAFDNNGLSGLGSDSFGAGDAGSDLGVPVLGNDIDTLGSDFGGGVLPGDFQMQGGDVPLPGGAGNNFELPQVNQENLGGCSYAAGRGCAQESSYSIFDIMFLILGLILLLPTAMAAYELIRYIWSWDQPYALNGTILEFIGGLFKL